MSKAKSSDDLPFCQELCPVCERTLVELFLPPARFNYDFMSLHIYDRDSTDLHFTIKVEELDNMIEALNIVKQELEARRGKTNAGQ